VGLARTQRAALCPNTALDFFSPRRPGRAKHCNPFHPAPARGRDDLPATRCRDRGARALARPRGSLTQRCVHATRAHSASLTDACEHKEKTSAPLSPCCPRSTASPGGLRAPAPGKGQPATTPATAPCPNCPPLRTSARPALRQGCHGAAADGGVGARRGGRQGRARGRQRLVGGRPARGRRGGGGLGRRRARPFFLCVCVL
jgi:hypothetical protein